MACYHPWTRYRLADGSTSPVERGDVVATLKLPCGYCIGCRIQRSSDWAIRCVHEASLYKLNDYITLTYDDAHLPEHGQLHYEHFAQFMKRVRQSIGPNIRFFMCGEYGETTQRPHFHAIIFNHQFKERKKWSTNHKGQPVYRSAELEKLWTFGQSLTGNVSKQSCGYVARYIMKKVVGDQAHEHYKRTDPDTGEIYYLNPEFCQMSRKPGIGYEWFRQYGYQVFDRDYVISNGSKAKPPRYYEKLHDRLLDPVVLEQTKGQRDEKSREGAYDNTDERLSVKEEVTKAAVRSLKRGL